MTTRFSIYIKRAADPNDLRILDSLCKIFQKEIEFYKELLLKCCWTILYVLERVYVIYIFKHTLIDEYLINRFNVLNINVLLQCIWGVSSRKEVVLCISDCLTLKQMRYAA